jgi:hypothetical protein
MGLDTIGIVMAVEDRFEINIRDDEAAEILMVGDLTRLVLSRIAARERHVCPTLQKVFTSIPPSTTSTVPVM